MIRTLTLTVIICSAFTIFTQNSAEAFFYGQSRDGITKGAIKQLHEGKPIMAPYGHVKFCVQNPGECVVKVSETAEQSRQELDRVNRQVNSAIAPRHDTSAVDSWNIAPKAGDCDDYAVTKRHELLSKGWPSSALRLAVASLPGTEDHLVLVVRLDDTDYVLDNLSSAVKPWSATGYRWLKIQSGENPKSWAQIDI